MQMRNSYILHIFESPSGRDNILIELKPDLKLTNTKHNLAKLWTSALSRVFYVICFGFPKLGNH